MSFSGIMLRVEDAPPGNGRSWGQPDHVYARWKMTVRDRFGNEKSASTGNSGYIRESRKLIGRLVTVSQGGKEGIVVGVRLMDPEDMKTGLKLSGWTEEGLTRWKSPSGHVCLGPAQAYEILCNSSG